MKKSHLFSKIIACLLSLGLIPPSNAVIIDVTKLNINSMYVSISSSYFPTQADTMAFSPPAVLNMGTYNGLLASVSFPTSAGSVNLSIESTDFYGASPPSGTVDTSLGLIDLNLPDLRATVSGVVLGDFDLWNPSTSTIDSDSYNTATSEFAYGWNDAVTLRDAIYNIPGIVNYSILLNGTASTVPVLPALWLFGSGLLGLVGIARRKKAA